MSKYLYNNIVNKWCKHPPFDGYGKIIIKVSINLMKKNIIEIDCREKIQCNETFEGEDVFISFALWNGVI